MWAALMTTHPALSDVACCMMRCSSAPVTSLACGVHSPTGPPCVRQPQVQLLAGLAEVVWGRPNVALPAMSCTLCCSTHTRLLAQWCMGWSAVRCHCWPTSQLSLLSKLGHQSEVRHAEGLLHQARDTRGSDARTPVMRDPWNGTPVLEPLTALPQAGAHAACKLKSWLERVCCVLTPVLGRAVSSRSGRASVCKR